MIDDYATYLSAEAASGLAALHQFKLLYSDTENEIHAFFEGEEDSLFYMPEIRRRAVDRKAHVYICGGKKNVVKAREIIKDQCYDIDKCLFFIDRDFDDYCGDQPYIDYSTYITDNYSIESDVVSQFNCELLLEDVLRISRADPEFAKIVAEYNSMEQQFASVIRPFMAWGIAAKAAGSQPNFNNVSIKSVISMSNQAVSKRPKAFVKFCRSAVGSGAGATRSAVLGWARRLPLADRKLWIRGKFYIWFFQMAILGAVGASNSRRTAAGGKPWKVPGALRDARLFELLGGRIPLPPSLTEYLQARI